MLGGDCMGAIKEELVLICPHEECSLRFGGVLATIKERYAVEIFHAFDKTHHFKNRKILFAVAIDATGIHLPYYKMLQQIRKGELTFSGCVGGVLIDGESELYTKSIARELMFAMNQKGCLFIGRGLVEATAVLQNFEVRAANENCTKLQAYHNATLELIERIVQYQAVKRKKRVLVLHASHGDVSNTLSLWEMTKKHLAQYELQEISLRNGTVDDCGACPYELCMHFSKKSQCYYGGVIVTDVYPAILDCDALVILAPNYNDAMSANLTAFVNRLTALFRRTYFYEKGLFSMVVSGYSGGDIVAEQILGALSINKTFLLPPHFSLVETANLSGSIFEVPQIEMRAEQFAKTIETFLEGIV